MKSSEKELGFGTCSKVAVHGTAVCAKTFRGSDGPTYRTKLAVVQEAAMLSKVHHPHIRFLIGMQTTKEPFQLITVFYSIDGVSLSVYDTLSVAKLTDTKHHVL